LIRGEVEMNTYKLPLSIRIPNFDEYPNGYNIDEINMKRDAASIIEGYKLAEVRGEKFTHFAELNIDADNLWNLFVALSDKLIGDIAYGIIGFKDEKPTVSNFKEKQRIIDILNRYNFELPNDEYIQFGIAHYHESSLNQIFITSFKYLQVWTTDNKELVETLNKYKMLEQENLNFIDEFPVVSEVLSAERVRGARHYLNVINEIERKFGAL
jgi:hypothetical protein